MANAAKHIRTWVCPGYDGRRYDVPVVIWYDVVVNYGNDHGVTDFGNVIIPFVDRFPKDTELYSLLTTRPNEKLPGPQAQ